MTHDKKGRFLSLHTFRDLKRLCGLASVSGYLLFAPYFPPCICLFLLLFFFFFSFCLVMIVFIHVLSALSHLFEDVRYTAACLFQVFILLFICSLTS